jgi:hypothetical protein
MSALALDSNLSDVLEFIIGSKGTPILRGSDGSFTGIEDSYALKRNAGKLL